MKNGDTSFIDVGWQEWVQLPRLGLPLIKAKVDTGAKTSSLHAFDIVPFRQRGRRFVSFKVHPLQNNQRLVVACKAPLLDYRAVMSSSGCREERYVIETLLGLDDFEWKIQLTLSNREPLRFRMLLGREALANRVLINPARRLCLGKFSKKQQTAIYKRNGAH